MGVAGDPDLSRASIYLLLVSYTKWLFICWIELENVFSLHHSSNVGLDYCSGFGRITISKILSNIAPIAIAPLYTNALFCGFSLYLNRPIVYQGH